MRFKVPQNIDMPDRILGPLTMLQFVEAVLGGGLAYITYVSMGGFFGGLLAATIALLTLAIIFLKINERPFSHFILSFFQYITHPKERVWHKGESSGLKVNIYKAKKKDSGPKITHKDINKEQIAELAKKLDTNGEILIKQ